MTPNRIAELRREVISMTNSAGGPTRYGDWITELLDAVEEVTECQQRGHIECCCDPEVAPWIHELRRLRDENAALSAGLDRALAFLSDCRSENERLLGESLELKMQPVFDEYREYRA